MRIPVSLPARARLTQAIGALVAYLPGQMGTLLDADRFAQGKEALLRLASTAEQAAQEMTEEEAGWIADRLLERWAGIADPILDPAIAIFAPREVWIGNTVVDVPIELAAAGLDGDAEVLWEGPVRSYEPGAKAILAAVPPEGLAKAIVVVRARVRGRRMGGARCVLVTETRVTLRRPVLIASTNDQRLVVQDQSGEPAAGVNVEIEGEKYCTDANGEIKIAKPLTPNTRILVAGVAATIAADRTIDSPS